MNFFDHTIIGFLNQFAQFSWTFDFIVRVISSNKLIKGGILLTILWWGWFKESENQENIRLHLISILFGCCAAILLGRGLALLLPYRLRPINEEGLGFLLPHGMEPTMMTGMSSFPSDHAVLFYTLSTGIFFISKKLGILSIIYTTLLIGLPRIYLLLHYPSDIFGGAFAGILTALLFNTEAFKKKVSQPVLNWSKLKPEIFYSGFFLITYQIADMFDSSRSILNSMWKVLKIILNRLS